MPFAQSLLEALTRDLPYLYGPLFLVFAATLMLWPGDLFVGRGNKRTWSYVAFLVLAVAGVIAMLTASGVGFSGMFRVDGLTKGFQFLCVVAGLITIVLSQPQLNALREQTVEYYALLLFSIAGMMLLVGATDLVSMYFSLELMALCIYILVAYFRTQERSIEAGMKYFLLGAFSSGILLYGISLLFAATGGTTTNLAELNEKLALVSSNGSLLVFAGVLMVLVGFAFKVAAVPFHMWSPDAYEGAPTPITAFMSMAPKAAALAAFVRVFGTGFHGVAPDWIMPLTFIAGASMVLGNVAALRQQSMKRLLAYSSIAHVGYMLLGVLSGDVQAGAQAIWLYMLTYLVMQSGAFAVIIYLQGKGEGERIDDFRGLAKRQPMLAFAMMVFLLSLAGIPPLLGFFSKFYLFKLAMEQGYTTLTVIALLTSAVAAYYYLNVVATMYFKEPATDGEVKPLSVAFTFVLTVTCALILVGTFFGFKLLDWTSRIVLG
ncbi:MAG: NADH-quinone oxidoreductase subunit N [Holophaga sp.]|nr:NADH-quinone oxidoreductase subunit N [Holophaga sp.]